MLTVVIGGGAAGMTAAAAAARAGSEVTLLEKNEKLGKKIYITGKGRCNVTNSCDFDTFIANIVRNPRFMYSSLRSFGPEDTMRMIEENGVRLKVERGNRVFPVTDHASDITKALCRALEKAGVRIRLKTEVISIEKKGEHFLLGTISSGKKEQFVCDRVIICTGGRSYPTTGSTGDGYRFAEKLGVAVRPQSPSLVSIIASDELCADLAGVSLVNTGLSVFRSADGKPVGKVLYTGVGELLFTHKGISGPLVLTASAILSGMISPETPYLFSVDLKPGLTEEMLDKRILRDLSERANMDMGNALAGLLIGGIREAVLKKAEIDPSEKARSVTRAQRQKLVRVIKHFDLTAVSAGGFEEAVVTKGGIDVKELDPRTMEVKKIRGLYFAGEVVDVDAFTGGFNLQCAFSMGHAAGRNVAEEDKQ